MDTGVNDCAKYKLPLYVHSFVSVVACSPYCFLCLSSVPMKQNQFLVFCKYCLVGFYLKISDISQCINGRQFSIMDYFFLFCVCDSDFPLKLFSPVVAISNIIFRQSVKSTQASAKSTPSGTPTRQSHSKRWVVALSSTIKLQVALFVSLSA